MDEHRNDSRRTGDEARERKTDSTREENRGEVLGISRSGGDHTSDRDEFQEAESGSRDRDTFGDERDRPHAGSRDVTDGTTGGTTPDTGGSGALRRGSGATGTDIGGR
jgi:hypothetical protein